MKPHLRRYKRTGYLATGALLVLASSTAMISQHAGATTVTDHDGINVTYTDSERVGATGNGLKYAPRPPAEYRHQRCSSAPQAHPPQISESQLAIPDVKIQAPIGSSSDLSQLPPAPEAVRYTHSAPLGAPQGKTIIAGHVDYAPGALSARGGELSQIGHLHTVEPCTHVFTTDSKGQQHEYTVTDLYTAPQDEIEDTGIYSTEGDPALVLVTCSGPSVGELGARIGFSYSHNLIVEATPVEVAS